MGFLGVYKAIYDYEPLNEGELPISEGDILYILDKSGEDDWWKAKKKASEDEEEPVGLIPNNYVEEAHPISNARALYDYTRQTDEELSFTENAQLEVFDTSDPDWILVGLDSEYGFAPANYIEMGPEVSTPQLLSPSLPERPRQSQKYDQSPITEESQVAPTEIVHQPKISVPELQISPELSDDEPPSRSRCPQSPDSSHQKSPLQDGPRMSPPYNRVSNPRGMDDEDASHAPGGFHMYNINEMISVMGKQKKMPTTLGINNATGVILIAPEKSKDGREQRWTADKMTHYSIEGKHVFLELVRPIKSVDFHAGAKDTAQEIVGALGELAGAVRAEGLREVIMAGSGQSHKKGEILYDFIAQGDDEVTVGAGDEVIVIDDSKSEEWWQIRRLKNGKEGVVPSSYVKVKGILSAPSSNSVSAARSTVEQNRLEEERLAKDSVRSAKEPRGTEVGPGMRLPERGSSLSTRKSSNSHDAQRYANERNDAGQSKGQKSKPDPRKVRTWNDRSKSFSVEAQFLALKDGKINLHKLNGVKIAVPVSKMSIEDLEYVERQTGVSLDDEKPLSGLRKARSQEIVTPREPTFAAGATIQRQAAKPEFDWFQFFLSCEVPFQLCERYSQAFQRDSMDESVLPDIDATVLRTLGIREGDIIKIMRFLDKKYSRLPAKRGVGFGGEEALSPDGEIQGSLFSGPGGTLKNNTRKSRPSPHIPGTNNTIDAEVFSQNIKDMSRLEEVATPTPPVPSKTKDDATNGFDDDAWDVKPSKHSTPSILSPTSTSRPPPISKAPTLSGTMGELSLLSTPLEPIKSQPKPPSQVNQPIQPLSPAPQTPQLVTPSFFTGIGSQQPITSNLQQNTQMTTGLNLSHLQHHPHQFQNQGLMLSAPNRPLSAPNTNLQSPFSLPPLQPQATGIQTSTGFQQSIVSHGMGAKDPRIQQVYNGFNGPQVINNLQQFSSQTSMAQQNLRINSPSLFSDPQPRVMQLTPIQAQPTGFQTTFSQPQFPQRTGINSFLPLPLQPAPVGIQQSEISSSLNPNISPGIQQQNFMMPLVPQKTGPPPPVRFGVTGDRKNPAPQSMGRRANLAQATPQNPFGF
ncbi:Actin cytoskeleton-regulatory complex protein [Podosphaera aphanis]|nr:Actin cytoskeleton-regulatory complex protein [Podosphaera aphanis]